MKSFLATTGVISLIYYDLVCQPSKLEIKSLKLFAYDVDVNLLANFIF